MYFLSIGYDKENAVTITLLKSDEKWNSRMKNLQEQWKEKEGSYMKKISQLTEDKQAMTLTIENIRESDFDKRQELLRIELEHKEKLDTITSMNRRYSSDTSREKTKLEELLKDKEFEVAKAMRSAEHLELTKEYLERELLIYKQRVHGHDASIKTVGFNFSVTQKDMSKKIVSLQNTVRILKEEKEHLMNGHTTGSHMSAITQGGTPTSQDDKIQRLKRQRAELKGIVTRMGEKTEELENRYGMLEETNTDLVSKLELCMNDLENLKARSAELREENDTLLNENIDIHEKLRDYPVNGYTSQQEFAQEREVFRKAMEDLTERNDALMMRCDRLKNDYQAAKEQTTRLLEDRDQDKLHESQINRLRERNQRLEQTQERYSQKMEDQRNEIERLQMLEQRALQADAYKRQLDDLKRHH